MEAVQTALVIDAESMAKGRNVYRALCHPLRQQILQLIHKNGRMIVTELYHKLKIEQSVASQQLAILRSQRFVNTERQGKFIFYSVNYQRIKQVEAISHDLLAGKPGK